MQLRDPTLTLDRQQLREITLDDDELMREVLQSLLDDTSRQIPLLSNAIRSEDAQLCARLAHYSKGACANVGASAAAELLQSVEQHAVRHEFSECEKSLAALIRQMEALRAEAEL